MKKKHLIKWRDEYSVGIEEIDKQHRIIFDLTNELIDYLEVDNVGSKMEEVIDILVDYAYFHFVTEEKYFETYDYKDKEEHIREHNEFRNKVAAFKKRMNNAEIEDKTELYNEVIDFLDDWWIRHILGSDKKYTECFHAHGLY